MRGRAFEATFLLTAWVILWPKLSALAFGATAALAKIAARGRNLLATAAVMLWRRIDLLVNNAGVFPSPLPNTPPKTFEEPLKLISGDSSTYRNLPHRRCVFRKSYQHFLRCTSDADDRSGCFACLC